LAKGERGEHRDGDERAILTYVRAQIDRVGKGGEGKEQVPSPNLKLPPPRPQEKREEKEKKKGPIYKEKGKRTHKSTTLKHSRHGSALASHPGKTKCGPAESEKGKEKKNLKPTARNLFWSTSLLSLHQLYYLVRNY